MKPATVFCFALSAAVFGADQSVKAYMEKEPSHTLPRKHAFLPITLHRSHNKGMFLNLLQDRPRAASFLSVSALGIFLFSLCPPILKKEGHFLAKTGAALVAGGALSNVFDHMRRGYVVDYFSLPLKKISHIIFNLGDFAIFIGCSILSFLSFTDHNLLL